MKKKLGIINSYKFLWKIMNVKEKANFVFIFLLSFIPAIANAFPATIPAILISKLTGEKNPFFFLQFLDGTNIWVTIISLYLITLGFWVLGILHYRMIDIFSTKMIVKINEFSNEKLLIGRKNMDFGLTDGEIQYIIKNASDNVYELIEPFCWQVFPAIFTCVLMLINILLIDWVVFLTLIGIILLVLLDVFITIKIQNPVVNEIERKNAKINNHFLKTIINIPLITTMQSKIVEMNELRKLNKDYYSSHKKRANIVFWYWVLIVSIEFLGLAGLLSLAWARQEITAISVSLLILIISYTETIYAKVEAFGYQISEIQQSAAKLCNLEKIIPEEDKIISIPIDMDEKFLNQIEISKIEIKNLNANNKYFDNTYNCVFNRGQTTALCGKSGRGKTTLVNLLCGLRETNSGEIIINDRYRIKSLFFNLDKISYIFQNEMLFDRSILKNIIYPNTEMTQESQRLIKAFGVTKFLEREASEDQMLNISTTLSGGEKKCISLIRGILKPAEIYIFDEPSNNLDQKKIDTLLKEIKRLKKDKIVIIISHDEKLIESCDNVINVN